MVKYFKRQASFKFYAFQYPLLQPCIGRGLGLFFFRFFVEVEVGRSYIMRGESLIFNISTFALVSRARLE